MAILIDMDMPKECHECPFQIRFKDGEADDWYVRRCVIEHQIIEYPRPDWCPLREVRRPTGEKGRFNTAEGTRTYTVYEVWED